jgi:signal transduction histidine kinase
MLEYCLEEGSHEGTPPKNYHTDHKRPNIQYLRIALENCRYLLNLSNDLLDLAQIKIGQFKLAKQTFNLKGLLKECISMFTLMATKKSI